MMKIMIVDKQPPPHFQAAAPARHPRNGPSMFSPHWILECDASGGLRLFRFAINVFESERFRRYRISQ
jgi:hypothetical protein